MNRKYILIIFATLFYWNHLFYGFTDCKLLLGTIALPEHFSSHESIRVWYSGTKVPCDVDIRGKKVSFELSIDKGQTFLYLIIVNDFIPLIDDNTVKHLSISPTADYKIFSLEYIDEQWVGTQLHISLSRIPDDAIIVYIPGSFVDHLELGSSFELPKIVFSKNLSETDTLDILKQQLLRAINYDSLHANVTRHIQQNALTTRVTFVT